MSRLDLKSLIGKLNNTCRNALESAAGLCLSQTHYEVDLEHFFIKLPHSAIFAESVSSRLQA